MRDPYLLASTNETSFKDPGLGFLATGPAGVELFGRRIGFAAPIPGVFLILEEETPPPRGEAPRSAAEADTPVEGGTPLPVKRIWRESGGRRFGNRVICVRR